MTIIEYLCHKWPRTCSVCRNTVLFSFITYHRVCNKGNTSTFRSTWVHLRILMEFVLVFCIVFCSSLSVLVGIVMCVLVGIVLSVHVGIVLSVLVGIVLSVLVGIVLSVLVGIVMSCLLIYGFWLHFWYLQKEWILVIGVRHNIFILIYSLCINLPSPGLNSYCKIWKMNIYVGSCVSLLLLQIWYMAGY